MSSDTIPGPQPLQDRSNAVAPTAADLEEKDREIESLKSLLNGLTKKRGRGRKRRVSIDSSDKPKDDEQDKRPAKKSKAEPAAAFPDYVSYGRTIARFLGPFVNIGAVIEYGTTMDSAMSDDEGETEFDPKLDESWKILWKKFPGFHEYLLKLTNQPEIRRGVIKQLTEGMESARSDDTGTLKRRVPLYVNKDHTAPLIPPLASMKIKAHRGMAHPVFARLLTPMELEANESTYREITEGVKLRVTGAQLPAFVFPLGQVFPVGKPLTDPAWLEVFDNALKGEVLLRSAKAIFMGPESALEGDGYHKGRPGNASIIMMTTFTRRIIAWVVVQVYFALSSQQEWYKTDGSHFNYEEFFWTIYGLFDNDAWGKEIIAMWNKVVLGTSSAPAPAAAAAAGPSALEQLKAARAAAAAAAAAPAPATADPASAVSLPPSESSD
ncbi:hypothetical protein FB451DRAFT_1563919 [Mycena latifolia]|nr:hypothetical protein FB451DRAFT_1563919 [Mycena latifolia]